MKSLNKNNGFTLIETLVSINLSVIAISLIFSFYLFAKKFSESLSRNYMDKYVQISFFNNLEKTLNNSDEYFIKFTEDRISIITSNEDSIFISKNAISINGISELTKLDSISIGISTDLNEEMLNWKDGVLENSTLLLNENSVLESNEIILILFEIKRNNKNCSFQYFLSPNSISRYKNTIY